MNPEQEQHKEVTYGVRRYEYRDPSGAPIEVTAAYRKVDGTTLPEMATQGWGPHDAWAIIDTLEAKDAQGNTIDLRVFFEFPPNFTWYCNLSSRRTEGRTWDEQEAFVVSPEPSDAFRLLIGVHEIGHAKQLSEPELANAHHLLIASARQQIVPISSSVREEIARTFSIESVLPEQKLIDDIRQRQEEKDRCNEELVRINTELGKLKSTLADLRQIFKTKMELEKSWYEYRERVVQIENMDDGLSWFEGGEQREADAIDELNVRYIDEKNIPTNMEQWKERLHDARTQYHVLSQQYEETHQRRNLLFTPEDEEILKRVNYVETYPWRMMERDANLFAHRKYRELKKRGFDFTAPIPKDSDMDCNGNDGSLIFPQDALAEILANYDATNRGLHAMGVKGGKTLSDIRKGGKSKK